MSRQLRQDTLDMFVTVVAVDIAVVIAVSMFRVSVDVMMITKFLKSMSDVWPHIHLNSFHTVLINEHFVYARRPCTPGRLPRCS